MRFLDIPIRLDSTLCDPGEIWLERPNGEAVPVLDQSGRLIAPPQPEPQPRPSGPWDDNAKVVE